jgi:hypothetical protein
MDRECSETGGKEGIHTQLDQTARQKGGGGKRGRQVRKSFHWQANGEDDCLYTLHTGSPVPYDSNTSPLGKKLLCDGMGWRGGGGVRAPRPNPIVERRGKAKKGKKMVGVRSRASPSWAVMTPPPTTKGGQRRQRGHAALPSPSYGSGWDRGVIRSSAGTRSKPQDTRLGENQKRRRRSRDPSYCKGSVERLSGGGLRESALESPAKGDHILSCGGAG